MILARSMKRFAALAAVFAITLQALWPLLSHARPNDISLLAPLCSVDGATHYLEIKAGKPTPLDQRSAQHGEHCKLCVFGDGKSLALVAPVSISLLTGKEGDETAVSFQSPFESPLLLPSQPRAPPAIA